MEEKERSAAGAAPANRRGRRRVTATTAGSSLFPRGITVVGRPMRTPKTVFGNERILQKRPVFINNNLRRYGPALRNSRIRATNGRILSASNTFQANKVPWNCDNLSFIIKSISAGPVRRIFRIRNAAGIRRTKFTIRHSRIRRTRRGGRCTMGPMRYRRPIPNQGDPR